MLWLIILILSALSTHGKPLLLYSTPTPNFEIQRIAISIVPTSTMSTTRTDLTTSEIGIVFVKEYEVEPRVINSYDTIDKLHVQEHITRRDIERSKRATWTTYFAEILAGLILLAGIIIFLCWWNCTKQGEQPLRTEGSGLSVYQRQTLYTRRGSGSASRRNSLMDLSVGSTPMKPMKPLNCPQSACVCGPGRAQTKGKRKWNYKEDNESYGPLADV